MVRGRFCFALRDQLPGLPRGDVHDRSLVCLCLLRDLLRLADGPSPFDACTHAVVQPARLSMGREQFPKGNVELLHQRRPHRLGCKSRTRMLTRDVVVEALPEGSRLGDTVPDRPEARMIE